MAKSGKSSRSDHESELDAFARQVEQILEHFSDAKWIGTHSPLAAPYFLGRALRVTTLSDNTVQRGESLQQALLQAATQLDHEQRELLRVVYFERNRHVENVGLALALHMSERTFYRMRVRAIQALALKLQQLLPPPLRTENPTFHALVGREDVIVTALQVLQAGGSVYLSGPSGIGKTTLGASLVRLWFGEKEALLSTKSYTRVFWYTLRSGLNDQVASLLFALGYFLHNLGASYTWRQMVADRGVTHSERTISLLRYDLHSLEPALPLLCVDDLDVLQAEANDHVQIFHILEQLRTLCPMLLIGQQVTLEADHQVRLSGLSEAEVDALLLQSKIAPLPTSVRRPLHTLMHGNPALLLLFAMLVRDGDDPEAALQAFAKVPALEALFLRIWRRLQDEERHLLMQLSVFRNLAPRDLWQEQRELLEHLQQRELVLSDDVGGVRCAPHLQALVYARIPAELLHLLHAFALVAREERGEYLAALYHAVEARQWAQAVWLWFLHRNEEINRGGGVQALTLLRRISVADLANEADRTALHIARAELLQLTGRPDEAEQELTVTVSPARSAMRAMVRRYEGFALDVQGRVEQALEKYRESLEAIAGMPQYHEVVVHSRLSFLHLYRLHNVEEARKQAMLARAKADGVLGDVEIMAGRYALALDYLLSAKVNAEQSGDLLTLSRIYSFLGSVYLRLGEADAALYYIELAMETDRKRGDEVGPLYDLLNRSYVHLRAGRPSQSLADAQDGLQTAQRLKNSYLVAGLAAGVAEAAYALGEWSQAEEYAELSLSQEEEFFRASALVILGMVRQKQGNYDEGVALLDAALENSKQIEDRFTEAYVLHSFGVVHHEAGNIEAARLAFATSLRIYQELALAKEAANVQERLESIVKRTASEKGDQ